jgi:hypothetical protein
LEDHRSVRSEVIIWRWTGGCAGRFPTPAGFDAGDSERG